MSNRYKRTLEKITDWSDKLFFVAPFTYNLMKNMLKARKWTIEGLVEDADLTKKQAKKIVDEAALLASEWLEEDTGVERGDRTDPFSIYENNLLIIYFIRSNKSYGKEIHQYCDDDLKLINRMVNEDDDREEWLSIAHHKRLNVLIEKYMNRFDKFRESKKYNGIWY